MDNVQVTQDIELYIPVASDLVEQYCQTSFEDEPDTVKYLDGSGGVIIWFPKYLRNLAGISMLDQDGNEVYSYQDVFPYPASPRKGLFTGATRRFAGPFMLGTSNIRVTGDWGLESTPSAIKLATMYTIKHLFNYARINEFVSKESAGGRYIELSSEDDAINPVPKMARRMLQPYVLTQVFA